MDHIHRLTSFTVTVSGSSLDFFSLGPSNVTTSSLLSLFTSLQGEEEEGGEGRRGRKGGEVEGRNREEEGGEGGGGGRGKRNEEEEGEREEALQLRDFHGIGPNS